MNTGAHVTFRPAVAAIALVALLVSSFMQPDLTQAASVPVPTQIHTAVPSPLRPVTPTVIMAPAAVADLTVYKRANTGYIAEGGLVTFTVVVTNLGPHTSPGFVLTDTLPASLTFVSYWIGSGTFVTSTGVWTRTKNLAKNGKDMLVLTMRVKHG